MNPSRIIPLLALAFLVIFAVSGHALGWAAIDWKIAHDFPQVKRVTPSELAAWLNNGKRRPPVLLDVRTAAEYEVSHLKNAERVQPGSPVSAIRIPKKQPIVTYCSVGYRSGAFAQALEQAGYTQVMNMEGSIFKWANQGRPIYRDGKQVASVHPYNRSWGLLLDKALRAEAAPNPR